MKTKLALKPKESITNKRSNLKFCNVEPVNDDFCIFFNVQICGKSGKKAWVDGTISMANPDQNKIMPDSLTLRGMMLEGLFFFLNFSDIMAIIGFGTCFCIPQTTIIIRHQLNPFMFPTSLPIYSLQEKQVDTDFLVTEK